LNLDLDGRSIFVAGGSRGIGLGIVEACLAEGARVGFTARGAEALEATRARLADQHGADRVWASAGDMRDSATIDRALAEAEAALGPPGFEVDDETWEAGLSQNLGSAFRLARGALRLMSPRNEGAIVLITSVAGGTALGTPLTYGTSKAAMNHMTKELARVSGKVRVNALAPGNIVFPGGEWEERSQGPRAQAWERWIKREVPLQRFGTPEETGAVAAFLLSPRASFVHGAIVPVDGGQTR
jgi:3-oxoacyl-[acyl-carrier protein] reductase